MVVLVATRMKTQDLRICGNNTNVQAFSLESVFLHVGSSRLLRCVLVDCDHFVSCCYFVLGFGYSAFFVFSVIVFKKLKLV